MKTKLTRYWLEVTVALVAIYLIWGTTYAAIRVVVASLPPLLAGGSRFVLAGALLLAALTIRGMKLPPPRRLLGPAATALLMITGSHALVAMAEVHVPSGQAAVVMSTMPMWMALFQWLMPGGRRPPAMVITGIMLGFCGVWLLSRPSGQVLAAPLLSLACAPPLWALGSILTTRLPRPRSLMQATALQMLMGGSVLLLLGTLRGEFTQLLRLDLAAAGLTPWLGLAYLAIFGSLVALCAYTWLLRELGPGPVSSYAFVNPLVAVAFGYLALGEQPSPDLLLGGGLVVGAVAMVLGGRLDLAFLRTGPGANHLVR
jgi:drug/metabolite transporter (DMT)-like permease